MKRILFIDWLRILAIALVFFFHTSHFFDPIYWHVKNPEQSQRVLLFLGFVNIWIMPLFFFLSGTAVFFGIRKPFLQYLKGKTSRLLVPFVMGTLLLIPPQKYLEALSNQKFSGGYRAFLGQYFGGGIFGYDMGFNFAWIGAISYHLWFLGHLFVLSVALFPLLKWISLKMETIGNLICRITSFRGGALLMFIPVALFRVLLRRHFPEYTGWCDISAYTLYFLYGYVYIHHEGLRNTIVKSALPALLTGSSLFILYMVSFRLEGTFMHALFQNNQVTMYYVFQESAGALSTWSWIIVILAAGMKWLNVDNRWRPALNEAVLPFYILHQTVLLGIGYWVVQWSWNPWAKFGFIAATALFTNIILYVFAIRPFNGIRFLFGMGRKTLPSGQLPH